MQTTIDITNCPHRIKLNGTLIDGKFTESEGNFFCVKYKVQVTMKNCANRCVVRKLSKGGLCVF